MQALSKRIHYGKFVAEAKFLAKREEYSSLIRARDADGLMRLLTDESVEAKVLVASIAPEACLHTLLRCVPCIHSYCNQVWIGLVLHAWHIKQIHRPA